VVTAVGHREAICFPCAATLYDNLGIDLGRTTLQARSGRPRPLVEDSARPLRELV
jgi:hypothetical protein